MKNSRREFLQWSAIGLAAWHPLIGRAQGLDKLLRFTVPYAPGTATDTIARFVADKVKSNVTGPIIVENRAGADGNIAADAVARSGTDSYNVLISGSSTHAANATLFGKLSYDPVRDFTPLTTLATAPFLLVVNPQHVAAKSVDELIKLAKVNPLSLASSSVAGRIAGEKFIAMAGIQALPVPYVSSSKAMIDLLGGQFDAFIADSVSAAPHLKAGKIKALAVTVAKRVPLFPDVPTLSELGFKDFDVSAWIAAWSAASTPSEVSRQLATWMNAAMDNPEGRAFLIDRGFTPLPGSPEQLRALQARDTLEWGKLIKAAGLVRT